MKIFVFIVVLSAIVMVPDIIDYLTGGDNRFEIIQHAKNKLIEATNVESSPEEMKVLDNILFRMWQMGWLPDLETETFPVVHTHWIPCENETGEGSNTYICPACGEIQILIDGTPKENGWEFCPHCGARMDEVTE